MSLQPEFVYAALVLPTLFALTLIGEGVSRVVRGKPATMVLAGGITFLLIVVSAYILILVK